MSLYPTGSRAPATTATSKVVRTERRRHKRLSSLHWQWCSHAHCSTARCTPSAAHNLSDGYTGSRAPAPTAAPPRSRPEIPSSHVTTPHGHPFAFAQASRATNPTNSLSLSGTPELFPARGRLAASTAAIHGCPPTRERRKISGVQPRQHLRREEVGQVLMQVVQGRHPPPPPRRGGARAAAPAAAPPGLEVVPAEAGAVGGDLGCAVRRGAGGGGGAARSARAPALTLERLWTLQISDN